MSRSVTVSRLAGLAMLTALFTLSLTGPAAAESMDDDLFTLVLVDELEYRVRDGSDVVTWEGQARVSNDDHAAALKSRGAYKLNDDVFDEAEFQLLYLRPFDEFVNLEVGVRHDIEPKPSRTFAVLGLNGLAPQWFEFDASLFLSEQGDVSARVEAEYDILLTQRLVLQPKVELDLAVSDDQPTGVGAGLSAIEAGLRLRYEIEREFAPYVGVQWERKFGKTASFAREDSEDTNDLAGVVGIRLFF